MACLSFAPQQVWDAVRVVERIHRTGWWLVIVRRCPDTPAHLGLIGKLCVWRPLAGPVVLRSTELVPLLEGAR